MGRTFEYWTGCGTKTVLSPDLNASENDVISLDDSESVDESSLGENPVSVERNNSTHEEDKESNIGQTITDDETDAEALDGNESDASMPALHGEVVEKASNDKLIAETEDEKGSNCSTKNSGKSEQITERDSSQSYKDTSTNWWKKNRLLSDGSDSDDSVTSLYGATIVEKYTQLRM
ncbi:hypothetical protein ZHAS_00017706 [Anopheles sinensis]|uniref:Uncharacterized protein n=1 Tax=Anopheles sinensis TaxID=74873 RepID=A0A084WH09_ANOSI|nr:hypothetical protein ZHAS_00017706 [Anopheles sinensis]